MFLKETHIELNMLKRAINAKLIVIIDFILTFQFLENKTNYQ
jgi:hypothetical protein